MNNNEEQSNTLDQTAVAGENPFDEDNEPIESLQLESCDVDVAVVGENPFDEDNEPNLESLQLETCDAANDFETVVDSKELPITPTKSNPFDEANEVPNGTNPFDTEDVLRCNEQYDNVCLATPANEAVRGRSKRDWDGEWEHVSSCVKQNFTNISVVAPEVVSSMMISKHVVYIVRSEPQNFAVRRRYNDFAWLRDTLAATYEGMFIPSIPATTLFSKNALTGGSKTDVNGDFVKNRMQQLHLFMQQLCTIPFLRTDPSLSSFLSVQNEKEFKQITESPLTVVNGGGVDNWTNVGLNMWMKLVDNTVINPIAADRLITDFRRQLDIISQKLSLVENECRATGRKAVLCANAMNTLSEQISNWSGVEAELLVPAHNEYVDPYGAEKQAHMDGLMAGHTHWAHSSALVPKILARLVMSHVQYQQVQVARFKEHLVMRDGLLRDLEKAERDRAKAQEDQQQASAAAGAGKRQSRGLMFSKGPEELEEVLQRKTEIVAQLQARADRITRGLVFCELHRFNKDRMQSLSDMLGVLAATHIQMSQATTHRWTDIAAQASLDTQQYTEKAAALLASAGALDEDMLGFEASGAGDAH